MIRLALCTIALAAPLVTASAVARQAASPSDVDGTMKRIGPATGAAIKAMLSMAYGDARTHLADVKRGLVETEAFFSGKRRSDGVKFAKDALARVDGLDQALASAAMITPVPPAESPVDAPMKRVGPAVAAAGKAIGSRAWADARGQLATARTGLMEAESFFGARNTANGVKFAKDALAKLGELDSHLAEAEVDPGTALVTLKELQGTCNACHTVFRVRDNMNFVLRPGSAAPPELATAQAAMRELQGACTACHATYRATARGEWILRPGT